MKWSADHPDEIRHAFPQLDGAAGLQALCGTRWTAEHGHGGAFFCTRCLRRLDEIREAPEPEATPIA
ncbi:MAG: hypothetical protein L0221_02960 [Chloroflexi bacterium]|nr:hypothetical protein [Chloroflexota bacterium]